MPSFPQIALCFPSFALRPQPFRYPEKLAKKDGKNNEAQESGELGNGVQANQGVKFRDLKERVNRDKS